MNNNKLNILPESKGKVGALPLFYLGACEKTNENDSSEEKLSLYFIIAGFY